MDENYPRAYSAGRDVTNMNIAGGHINVTGDMDFMQEGEELGTPIVIQDENDFNENGEVQKKHFPCRFCGKVYDRHQALGGHMNGHQEARDEEKIQALSRILEKKKKKNERNGLLGEQMLHNNLAQVATPVDQQQVHSNQVQWTGQQQNTRTMHYQPQEQQIYQTSHDSWPQGVPLPTSQMPNNAIPNMPYNPTGYGPSHKQPLVPTLGRAINGETSMDPALTGIIPHQNAASGRPAGSYQNSSATPAVYRNPTLEAYHDSKGGSHSSQNPQVISGAYQNAQRGSISSQNPHVVLGASQNSQVGLSSSQNPQVISRAYQTPQVGFNSSWNPQVISSAYQNPQVGSHSSHNPPVNSNAGAHDAWLRGAHSSHTGGAYQNSLGVANSYQNLCRDPATLKQMNSSNFVQSLQVSQGSANSHQPPLKKMKTNDGLHIQAHTTASSDMIDASSNIIGASSDVLHTPDLPDSEDLPHCTKIFMEEEEVGEEWFEVAYGTNVPPPKRS